MVRINRVEAQEPPYITMSINKRKIMEQKSVQQLLLKLFLTIAFVYVSTMLFAQAPVKALSLDEAIQTAIANNKNIALAVMDEKISLSNYKQTEAIHLPQVSLSYTALVTDNPLNAFGVKLQQSKITANDFNPALLNNPAAASDFMTRLDVQQPIINLDRNYQRKAALKQTEIYQFKTQRTKEFITYQVQHAYLQLQLTYEAKKVLEASLQTVNALLKFSNDRYAQGLLQKSDVLNVEVQIKSVETNIAATKNNIADASDYLSMLMNVPATTVYTAAPLLLTANVTSADSLSLTRADFKAMRRAIESYNLNIESSKKSYLPRLNAFANYQLNDSKIFGFGANAYMAGLQLSWDIFKGNQTKNKISTQILERNKVADELAKQQQESTTELQKTKRQLADAMYKMKQQQAAIQLADEALRILQNRYAQGLVNTTDVLAAQTQLSQQNLLYQQAVYTSNVTNAYLQFLTSK